MAKEVKEKTGSLYGESILVDLQTQNEWVWIGGLETGRGTAGPIVNGGIFAYTAVSDIGGGQIRVFSLGHGFSGGEYISLLGGIYDGRYIIQNVPNGNEFDIDAVFTSTDAAEGILASIIEIGSGKEGEYKMNVNMSVSSGVPGQDIEINWSENNSVVIGGCGMRKLATNDIGHLGACYDGFLGEGSKVGLLIRSTSVLPGAVTLNCVRMQVFK